MDILLNKYSEYLTCVNLKGLIDILETLVFYKKNTSISKASITMFWTVSILIETFYKMSLLVI